MYLRSLTAKIGIAALALGLSLAGCSSNSAPVPNAPQNSSPNANGGITPFAVDAFLRFVHGSPNAGPVDIYVYSSGSSRPSTPSLSNVAYSTGSTYMALSPGSYTVDILPHGASCTSKAVLSESVNLGANVHESIVVAGEAGANLQFVNFIEPNPMPGENAIVFHNASPLAGCASSRTGVAFYDAATVTGTPAPSQTTQIFAYSFVPGTSGPATSGQVSGGEFFMSPVASASFPATLGLAVGTPAALGSTHLQSVAFAAPNSTITGHPGFPMQPVTQSFFQIDAGFDLMRVMATPDQ